PDRSLTNTIRSPSGDHAGGVSDARSMVRFRAPWPSIDTRHAWSLPAALPQYASALPSGDHVGLRPNAPATSVSPEPSTPTTRGVELGTPCTNAICAPAGEYTGQT